jgi:UDP-glucose 4-epimerase
MKILLTGSSGRVGTAVATLLAADHEITGLDLGPGTFTTVHGDVSDSALINAVCQQQDAVIHTAALHAPHVGHASDDDFRRINVHGTQNLLDACRRHAVPRFVFTSSTSVYGDALVPGKQAVWVDETLTPQPRDIYDETKRAAENACRSAAADGLRCTVLRMSRSFPEAERLMALYRLYRGVDLRDVAQAHALALGSNTPGFRCYVISAPTPFQPSDCVQLLHDAAAVINRYFPWSPAAFARRGWLLPQAIDRVYAIDHAVAELGYRPRFGFETLFDAVADRGGSR